MKPLYNRSELKERRKELRSNSTPAEAGLWRRLKNCQLNGRRFRRQYSINNYILDFYCPSERLAIELDGQHHYTTDGAAIDFERDSFLKGCNVTVLRFENRLVFENMEGVIAEIQRHFKTAE